jgi:hypothetical protein
MVEECYTSQIFFSKMSSQMMCHHLMRFIILESVSPTHRIVTHHLRAHFYEENLGCITFFLMRGMSHHVNQLMLSNSCLTHQLYLLHDTIILNYQYIVN